MKKYPELTSGLSIVVMNYMDAFTMDLKRLKECSMTVLGEDERIVPFFPTSLQIPKERDLNSNF